MASAGKDDAIGEEAEVGSSTKKNRRRISDYLGDSESSPPETPPQLRLPGFTCARFRFVRLGRKRGGRKEVGANKTEDASLDSSAGSNKPAETSTSGSSASAEAGGGMGLSMLLLLARTCVELNRMAEVRAQMEALLKEIRDEASRVKAMSAHHHGGVTPARTFNLQMSPSSSCTSDTDTNRRHAATSSSAAVIARGERESKPKLVAEDDGRDWDAGDEDSDEESAGAQDSGGVCGVELERRLHELLHQRNRERIEELESALRRAEQKLREKEMEARLWQDTATLALQPPSQHGQQS